MAPVRAAVIGETVTVLRADTSTDPYSLEQTVDWTLPPNETDIDGCLFDPGNSGEPVTDWRSGRSEAPTLYLPATTDPAAITAADRVRVRGDLYEVVGRPQDWSTGARRFGLVAKLSRFGG